MAGFIGGTIPRERLIRLEFMLGEMSGLETLHPPGQPTVQFPAILSASWEECERFIKIDFFCNIPTLGVETFRALITWSNEREAYRMWAFCASQEEPLHMAGDFDERGRLVFLSDPWKMPWGLQKMRSTFTPFAEGGFEYECELWEPDGYVRYCNAVFSETEAFASPSA